MALESHTFAGQRYEFRADAAHADVATLLLDPLQDVIVSRRFDPTSDTQACDDLEDDYWSPLFLFAVRSDESNFQRCLHRLIDLQSEELRALQGSARQCGGVLILPTATLEARDDPSRLAQLTEVYRSVICRYIGGDPSSSMADDGSPAAASSSVATPNGNANEWLRRNIAIVVKELQTSRATTDVASLIIPLGDYVLGLRTCPQSVMDIFTPAVSAVDAPTPTPSFAFPVRQPRTMWTVARLLLREARIPKNSVDEVLPKDLSKDVWAATVAARFVAASDLVTFDHVAVAPSDRELSDAVREFSFFITLAGLRNVPDPAPSAAQTLRLADHLLRVIQNCRQQNQIVALFSVPETHSDARRLYTTVGDDGFVIKSDAPIEAMQRPLLDLCTSQPKMMTLWLPFWLHILDAVADEFPSPTASSAPSASSALPSSSTVANGNSADIDEVDVTDETFDDSLQDANIKVRFGHYRRLKQMLTGMMTRFNNQQSVGITPSTASESGGGCCGGHHGHHPPREATVEAVARKLSFDDAQSWFGDNAAKLSDKVKLKGYALFKQATVGDVQGSRPWLVDVRGRAKYDAWANVKGMTKADAETAYTDMVNRLMGGERDV